VSHRLVYRPDALEEIASAAGSYEERAPGLGAEFIRALDVVLDRIKRDPLHHPVVHGQLRRALLKRFPYSVIFSELVETVVIVGCVHWREKPTRWRDRR
jgi:hypothetical protein